MKKLLFKVLGTFLDDKFEYLLVFKRKCITKLTYEEFSEDIDYYGPKRADILFFWASRQIRLFVY